MAYANTGATQGTPVLSANQSTIGGNATGTISSQWNVTLVQVEQFIICLANTTLAWAYNRTTQSITVESLDMSNSFRKNQRFNMMYQPVSQQSSVDQLEALRYGDAATELGDLDTDTTADAAQSKGNSIT
ncbi:hypothetical protein MVEN_01827800 [Mycena venus]|uniref:Uncharacterized protein n=1 Tax=Mycena venus TaxID=2733690 RepID=A0A8H7CP50_9AGAR|nr:hypothetical protein MVEN_01827800 [Mycena venus]